jgi:CRP-like cAMP-binding protein
MSDHSPRFRRPHGRHSRVGLLDIDADLDRVLSATDLRHVAEISLPVLDPPDGSVVVDRLLEERGAFAAVVLEAMLLHYLQVGTQPGLRLLGPGEVALVCDRTQSTLVAASECRAVPGTRLALLGKEYLVAVHRWPRILVALQTRLGEQTERLMTQLAICQLPRVEERLVAMLWLLAESWGRVTTAGTIVPLSLTHELLGQLIGARRSTVTLALSALAEQQAVVALDRGWLLLQRPANAPRAAFADEPRVLDRAQSDWQGQGLSAPAPTAAALSETVRNLRAQHLRTKRQVGERLRRVRLARERNLALRDGIRDQRTRAAWPPRSGRV